MNVGDAVLVVAWLRAVPVVVPAWITSLDLVTGAWFMNVLVHATPQWSQHQAYYAIADEGVTWMRGHDTEDAQVLEAHVRLLAP